MLAQGVLRDETLVQRLNSAGIFSVEDMLSHDTLRFCANVFSAQPFTMFFRLQFLTSGTGFTSLSQQTGMSESSIKRELDAVAKVVIRYSKCRQRIINEYRCYNSTSLHFVGQEGFQMKFLLRDKV